YAFPDAAPAASSPYIRLMHRADSVGVHIDIHDNGMAFDPTELPPPADPSSIESASIGGHGVQLMRHYLKHLSYARVDAENRLTLTADLPAGPDEANTLP